MATAAAAADDPAVVAASSPEAMRAALEHLLTTAQYVAKGSFGRVFRCSVDLGAADTPPLLHSMAAKLAARGVGGTQQQRLTVAVKECRLRAASERWSRNERLAFENEVRVTSILDQQLGARGQAFPVYLGHYVAADTLVPDDVSQPSVASSDLMSEELAGRKSSAIAAVLQESCSSSSSSMSADRKRATRRLVRIAEAEDKEEEEEEEQEKEKDQAASRRGSKSPGAASAGTLEICVTDGRAAPAAHGAKRQRRRGRSAKQRRRPTGDRSPKRKAQAGRAERLADAARSKKRRQSRRRRRIRAFDARSRSRRRVPAASAALASPELVPSFGYVVMELIEGPSLYSYHPRSGRDPYRLRGGPPPPGAVLTLLRTMYAFVARMHDELGLYLQDVSPNNVMLRRADDWASVVFVDFGLVGASPGHCGDGTLLGPRLRGAARRDPAQRRELARLRECGREANTPGYLAFERWLLNERYLDRIDWGRADVYALATVVHDCMYGRLPVRLASSEATRRDAMERGEGSGRGGDGAPPKSIDTGKRLAYTFSGVYLRDKTPEECAALLSSGSGGSGAARAFYAKIAAGIKRWRPPASATNAALRRLLDAALQSSETQRPTARQLLLDARMWNDGGDGDPDAAVHSDGGASDAKLSASSVKLA